MYIEEFNSDDYEENVDVPDYYNELEKEIEKEYIFDYKINVINNFKNSIILEPEFMSINNISSIYLLNLIEYYDINYLDNFILPKKLIYPTDEQYKYFNILLNLLDCTHTDNNFINFIVFKIKDKLYV